MGDGRKGMERREALLRLGAAPVAAGYALSDARAERAHQHVHPEGSASEEASFERSFFDDHEWATVRVLSNLVIPADDRSGSATDAKVPEFIDFILTDELADAREREDMQTAVRGGLAWLDRECRTRFTRSFVECPVADQKAVLDDIAWPAKAASEMSQGVAFFNLFRDLVASGFWTSKMGMDDIGYMGNTFVAEWTGCPPEVLKKDGVRSRLLHPSPEEDSARPGGGTTGTASTREGGRR